MIGLLQAQQFRRGCSVIGFLGAARRVGRRGHLAIAAYDRRVLGLLLTRPKLRGGTSLYAQVRRAIVASDSASEIVAAFARENRLATLVGARTSGQVLGGANFALGAGYVLRLPAAGWYMWSDNQVERLAVQPDLCVQLEVERRHPVAGSSPPCERRQQLT